MQVSTPKRGCQGALCKAILHISPFSVFPCFVFLNLKQRQSMNFQHVFNRSNDIHFQSKKQLKKRQVRSKSAHFCCFFQQHGLFCADATKKSMEYGKKIFSCIKHACFVEKCVFERKES